MSSTTATATAAALDDNKRFLSTMDHVIKELTPHFRQAVKEGAMTERTAKIWILREAMEHAEPDIAAAIAKDKGIELSGETLQRAHFLLDQWLPTVDLQCKVRLPMTYELPSSPENERAFVILAYVLLTELVGAAGAAMMRKKSRTGCGGEVEEGETSTGVPTPYDDPLAFAIAPWQPPGWVFWFMWTIVLYPAIGLAGAIAFLHHDWNGQLWLTAQAIWFVQLFFNALWTPLFFGKFMPDAAFLVLLMALGFAVAETTILWFVDPLAFGLFVGYDAWLLFAATLNWYTVAFSSAERLQQVRDRYNKWQAVGSLVHYKEWAKKEEERAPSISVV